MEVDTGRGDGKLKNMATLPIPFPGKTGRPRKNLDAKKILALRAQGLSWRKIAKRMRVGAGTAFRAAQGRSKSVSYLCLLRGEPLRGATRYRLTSEAVIKGVPHSGNRKGTPFHSLSSGGT